MIKKYHKTPHDQFVAELLDSSVFDEPRST